MTKKNEAEAAEALRLKGVSTIGATIASITASDAAAAAARKEKIDAANAVAGKLASDAAAASAAKPVTGAH